MAPISKRTTLLMENGLTKQKIIRTLKKNRKYRKKSHGDKNTTDTDVKEEINDELDSMEQELYDPELEVKEEIEDLTITKDDLKKIKEEINDTFESSEPELCQPQFDVKHEIDEIDIKDVDLQSSDIEVHDHPLEDNGDGVLLHKCQECNFISPHLHSIKRHFKSHLKTQYKCDNCSFVSLRSLDYRTHIIFCKNNSSDINVTEGTEGADEETLDIDIEKLISLVYERPCLWEVKSADYASKSVRKTAWEEIVLQFAGENSTMTQKIELGRNLQKKWQNIRGNYLKSLRQKQKSGSRVLSPSDYLYYNQLQFLRGIRPPKETTSSLDERDEDEEREEPSRKKKNANQFEEDLLEEIKKNRIERERQHQEENEDDKLFLLSLLPLMKIVPRHSEIDCRMNVLQAIKKYSTFQTSLHIPQHSLQSQDFPQSSPSTSSQTLAPMSSEIPTRSQ